MNKPRSSRYFLSYAAILTFTSAGCSTEAATDCVDADNDGYGVNCVAGIDCDDTDELVWDSCSGTAGPTVLSITGTAGTTDIVVLFDESVDSPTTEFNSGWTFLVNGVATTFVYASGAATNSLTYTSGVTIATANKLDLSYDPTAVGPVANLQSVASTIEVSPLTNLIYFVPGAGVILFEDDFNSTPDMSIEGRYVYANHPDGVPAGLPSKYDYLYTSNTNPTNPPGRIASGIGFGGTKGLQVYDESGGTNSNWGHDIQLMKHFGDTQYPEMWVTVNIRWNPNIDTNNFGQAKIFRIGHYNPRVADGTAKTSLFTSSNDSAKNDGLGATMPGLALYDIRQDKGRWFHRIAERGSQDANYKLGKVYDRNSYNKFAESPGGIDFNFIDAQGVIKTAWADTFGDGKWHTLELGLVTNSSINAEDGSFEIWFDGVLQGRVDNVPFRQTGIHSRVTGWNGFTLGGNGDWQWSGSSNEEVEFYVFDNVKVSTQR